MVRATGAIMRAMLAATAIALPAGARAESGTAGPGISGNVVRIGIMNDQSGPYADHCGPGSVASARLAVQDHNGQAAGRKVELLVADDQNKPDVGLALARRWLDQNEVDAIIGCSASSIALAVSGLMEQRKKPYFLVGTASAALSNERCSPMNTQWLLDVYSMPKAVVNALLGRGLDTWFFITVDYSFGKDWQAETTRLIEKGGGKVVGAVLHPLNTADFSSFILSAQASKAKVIALANSGTDQLNALKQGSEFGVKEGGQTMTPLTLSINATHGIGLGILQDTIITTPFYWDRTDEARTFTKRYQAAFDGRVPNEAQASTYSAVNHYLKAIDASGTDDGPTIMKTMREIPVNDPLIKDAPIRADGQVLRPVYVARIKTPAESKYRYDYYELIKTLSPDEVYRPVQESHCHLMRTQ